MRIINREEFLKLPPGQLYRKFNGVDLDSEMAIKRETTGNDWYVQYLDWLDADNDGIETEMYEKALNDSTYEMEVDFDMEIRDGLYDYDQLFAVYNKDEIKKYIELLERLLKDEKK